MRVVFGGSIVGDPGSQALLWIKTTSLSVAPPIMEGSYWSTPNRGSDRVMLRIAKAGCCPVAIAQVVEHRW